MKGRISLKDFIHGVKRELIDTSATAEGDPAFEMTEVELEAEFVLEASAKVEGGFAFFVKAEGGTAASQTHKVKITLRPLKKDPAIGFGTSTSTTEALELKLPITSVIGSPMFLNPPAIYHQQGFPYVHFDPSRQIIGATNLDQSEVNSYLSPDLTKIKQEGDA